MSYRSLLMAGATAISIVASAQSAAALGPSNFTSQLDKGAAVPAPSFGETISLAAGQYTLSFLWTSISTGIRSAGVVEYGAYLVDSTNTLIAEATSAVKTSPATSGGSVLSSIFTVASAGNYTLQFAATQTISGEYIVSGAQAAVTAVPGPLAAAGLPGLAGLIGFGLYRRRAQRAA